MCTTNVNLLGDVAPTCSRRTRSEVRRCFDGYSSFGEQHILRIASMSKIFCDPVHGHISLHPICVAIIDTPEFQRLRNIKQTGLLEYVYPGATHNRFSHSLGVCYLAGKFMQQLREKQPELGITAVDILCVELAGLCHDLGHGPLSHIWEIFMQLANEKKDVKQVWKHEIVSQNMFDHLISKNGLIPEMKKFGLGVKEIKLIKRLIAGDKPDHGEKMFIYQIVNNEDSGLDVDKWDYFLRDCYYLGLPCSFEYERLMQFARVINLDGKKQICFRDKVLDGVYNVFRTRSSLHKMAYQHKIVKVFDAMFLDAVLEADGKVLGPTGKNLYFWDWSMAAAFGNGLHLSKALDKFSILTDSLIFTSLKYTTDSSLQNAAALICAIEKRSFKCCGLYQHIALKISPVFLDLNYVYDEFDKLLPSVNVEVYKEIKFKAKNKREAEPFPVTLVDVNIQIIPIHWGKREKNPVEFVHFYAKDEPLEIQSLNHEESSIILPKAFQEIQVHVICRRSDDYAVEVARRCVNRFWNQVSTNASHL